MLGIIWPIKIFVGRRPHVRGKCPKLLKNDSILQTSTMFLLCLSKLHKLTSNMHKIMLRSSTFGKDFPKLP